MVNDIKTKYKNQHYVPQYYFRQFSRDGKTIQIYDKVKREHYKNAAIKKQCSEDYFLGKLPELEKNITELESEFKIILDKLSIGGFNDITDEEYRKLLTFLCFQHRRTRHQRDLINKLSTEMHKKLFKELRTKTDLGEKLSDDVIKNISVNDPRMFVYSFSASLYSGVLLSDLKKCLLINKTNRRYVFSDSPVVLHNSVFSHIKDSGVGYQSPGLQVIFPISNNRAILLFDSKYYKIDSDKELLEIYNKKDIELINLVQMLYCKKLIYFSNNLYAKRLHKLRESYNKLFEPPSIKIQTFKSVNDNIPKELFKHYNTLFNLKLKLSFIEEKSNPGIKGYCRDESICNFFEKVIDENLKGKFRYPTNEYDVKIKNK